MQAWFHHSACHHSSFQVSMHGRQWLDVDYRAGSLQLAVNSGRCRVMSARASCRFVQDHAGDGAALLQLLDMLLASVGHMGAPVIISCPATLETIRALALQIGQHYADLAPPEGSTADPGFNLCHAHQIFVACCVRRTEADCTDQAITYKFLYAIQCLFQSMITEPRMPCLFGCIRFITCWMLNIECLCRVPG